MRWAQANQSGTTTFLVVVVVVVVVMEIQCPPLNRITLGRHKSENNNRMILLTDVFCAMLIYNWAGNI
jgi:hypothetical protein